MLQARFSQSISFFFCLISFFDRELTKKMYIKIFRTVEIVTHLIVVDGANTQNERDEQLIDTNSVALGHFEWRALHTTTK